MARDRVIRATFTDAEPFDVGIPQPDVFRIRVRGVDLALGDLRLHVARGGRECVSWQPYGNQIG